MGGDLFEILFVIAFILFGILGGRKKKKPEAGQGRPPRPRPRPHQRPDSGWTSSRQSPGARRSPQSTQDTLLRELEDMLSGRQREPTRSGRAPSDRIPDPDEARSLESLDDEVTESWEEGLERAAEVQQTSRWLAGRERGALTLETMEGAGEASHVRFHERPPLAAPPVSSAGKRASFDLGAVRRAVIWSEILGPPVSLR